MPSEYLFLSSPLPSMQDGGSLREQVDKLTNILLQTQEGLRFRFSCWQGLPAMWSATMVP